MAQARGQGLSGARRWALTVALAALGAGCPPPAPAPVEITIPAEADTTLFESPAGAIANGAGEFLFTGRTDQGKRRRALLRFDIAGAVPPGAAILEATLRLELTRTISGPVTHRIFVAGSDWGEGASDAPAQEGAGTAPEPGDATWIHTFFDTQNWPVQGGGDFPEEETRAEFTANGLGTYVVSSQRLADDVQAWLDGDPGNFGWIVLGDETAISNAKQWRSRESAVAAERPALIVKYQP